LWIDGHHIRHWAHGGPTNLNNLVLLCYRHQWLVHEGGWQVVRTDHQQVLAISPFHPHRSWTRAPDGALTT
jgi:predicted restriction endonuclease